MGTRQPGIARRAAAFLLAVVAASLTMAAFGTATASADEAPVVNESFETGTGLPAGWKFVEYTAGASTSTIATGAGADGSHFLQIVSDQPNHARVVIPVPVKANTTYTLRAVAKSSGTDPKQAAAVLGVEGTYSVTDSVRVDKDWQPLELLFKTGSQTSVELALSLGYFSSSNTGTASFDAVAVTPLAAPPADKPIADLSGQGADGGADNAQQAESAAGTAGSNSRGPNGALWVVLAILLIGGIAAAVFLARDGHGASAERDGDHGEKVGTGAGEEGQQPIAPPVTTSAKGKDVTVEADRG